MPEQRIEVHDWEKSEQEKMELPRRSSTTLQSHNAAACFLARGRNGSSGRLVALAQARVVVLPPSIQVCVALSLALRRRRRVVQRALAVSHRAQRETSIGTEQASPLQYGGVVCHFVCRLLSRVMFSQRVRLSNSRRQAA
jgi:hypothetical protein